jgi:hypothetical protein
VQPLIVSIGGEPSGLVANVEAAAGLRGDRDAPPLRRL